MTRSISVQLFPAGANITSRRFEDIPWYPGITVLEAMKIADGMCNDTFTFRLVYASEFGAYVDQIDGMENTDDHAWLLYLDGRLSETGISETMIPEPSTGPSLVEWRFVPLSLQQRVRGRHGYILAANLRSTPKIYD